MQKRATTNSHERVAFVFMILPFVDEIKDYFGSTIAIYFAFLEYYTIALVPLVLLVFFFSLFNFDDLWYNLIFALINVLWGTLFLEFWKRNCATMTHRWGTLKLSLGNYSSLLKVLFLLNLWPIAWGMFER